MATKTKPNDLRRLMKEQLNKSKKKIDSPLARYNNADQLFCVLCNTILKSDLLWDAHIRGAKHKENLIALKSGKSKPQPSVATKHHPVQKDKLQNSSEVDNKFQAAQPLLNKRKNEQNPVLPNETPPKKLKASAAPVKSSIPSDFFDKDVSNSGDDQQMLVDSGTAETSTIVSSTVVSDEVTLPPDFFDDSNAEKEELDNPSSSTDKQGPKSEAIPEGFFDDPKLDAKARKVEYKDPADEEWEKFQKALSTENQVSEAIIVGEEEESRVDRALDEISEQRLYYIRADTLRDKQSVFKKSKEEKRNQSETLNMIEESDSSSDDMEELFNWRAKKAL